jgi:hypothetical protein
MLRITPFASSSLGKDLLHSFDRKLDGPQCGENTNLALPGIEPGPWLYQVSCPGSSFFIFRIHYFMYPVPVLGVCFSLKNSDLS